MDQWNKIEHSEINLLTYGHLIHDKGAIIYNGEKNSLFNNWCWENWTTTRKRMKLEHSLTPHIKINAKWIKDLNVRLDTIQLLEENIGRTLDDINQNKIIKENNSKWNNWQKINFQNIQAAHTTQWQKNKQPNHKVGKRPKQTFLQRRHTDG